MPAHVIGEAEVFAEARRLDPDPDVVEDFATATIELTTGTVARVACSWKVAAGCDAQISVAAFGTNGGVAFRNVGGSFYDFVAERYHGTQTECLCAPPDAWAGRAAVAWVAQLARHASFDPSVRTALIAAHTLDRLYGRFNGVTTRVRQDLAAVPTVR